MYIYAVFVLIVIFSPSLLFAASDNNTSSTTYSITDFVSYSTSSASESYSNVYKPTNAPGIKIVNSFGMNSSGIGISRVHNIISTTSQGSAYISQHASYKAIEPASYMNVSGKMAADTCGVNTLCDSTVNNGVYVGMAEGYSAKLSNGYVTPSMVAVPMAHDTQYAMYAESNSNDGELREGISSSSSSSTTTQSYERHIYVTGAFSVNNSAEMK